MQNDVSTATRDTWVRRVRIVGAGVLCGVLVWCALRAVPQAFGQADPEGDPEPPYDCYPELERGAGPAPRTIAMETAPLE